MSKGRERKEQAASKEHRQDALTVRDHVALHYHLSSSNGGWDGRGSHA